MGSSVYRASGGSTVGGRILRRVVTALAVPLLLSILIYLLLLAVSCVPTIAVSTAPPSAEVGKGGELALSLYKGYFVIQKHAFLGIGIPTRQVHRYPSREAWDWYHQPDRSGRGAWVGRFSKDRRYGPMASWYHGERWILWTPLWAVAVLLGAVASTLLFTVRAGARALGAGYRAMIHDRRACSGLCVNCGYNLTGNISGTCPECGKPIPVDS